MGRGVRAGRRMAAWGGGAAKKRHARGRTDPRPGGQGTRGAHTMNMLYMRVTLDVSRLSGWLNADAYCRVEGRA